MDVPWNTILLAIIAVANALAGYWAYRTRLDIRTLEVNTNGIKDALVARTAEASEAKGRDTQRAVADSVAAGIAKAQANILNVFERGAKVPAPVPVADDRVAGAAERSAIATERVASATEKKLEDK